MALSGLDIYKLLPKTNCKECGFATCLAFAMQLAKKAVSLDKCPHVTQDAKQALEASSQPPIRLVTLGKDENKLEVGNETVLFRHDEKFHHPCGIGLIIEDNLDDAQIKDILGQISKLKFERVGQEINVDLVAVRQNSDAAKFVATVKLVSENCPLALVLICKEPEAARQALEITKDAKPLIYPLAKDKLADFAKLAQEFKTALAISAPDLESLSALAKDLNSKGLADLVLDISASSLDRMVWNLTQIRRLALKKQERSLGFPILILAQDDDPYLEVQLAATCVAKYGSIVLMKARSPEQVLSILTLRQNIYTDPQKPLQVEPKLYPVGAVSKESPLIVTTNFSLTYYTVLGEVEASKMPTYILSADTEGMSVLTAWAAEKFTPESIAKAIESSGLKDIVSHQQLIIPGYVAVMSGSLEEKSGWKVLVGPKEASGISSFLKKL